jgi:uncharacterized membrane protein YbhN (UPF0104 family)
VNRRRLWLALRVAVTAAALVFLVHKAGIGPTVTQLAHARPGWLVLGFGLGVLSALWTVLQWHRLVLAAGLRRSYRRCLHLELAGDVFDAALPSAVGGDLVRAVLVASAPEERVPGAASVLLRRLCNFPGMVVVMAVGTAASLGLAYSGRIRPYSLIALAFGALASAVTFSPLLGWLSRRSWLGASGPQPRVSATPASAGPAGRQARAQAALVKVGRVVGKVCAALGDVRDKPGALAAGAARGVVFWSIVVASQWAFMRAVGIHVPLWYAAAVVTTTNAITMLPISLGGYGLREGSFASFLAVGGMATYAQGTAVGICLTAQTMAFGLIGLPFYLTARRAGATMAQLRSSAAQPAAPAEPRATAASISAVLVPSASEGSFRPS